MYDNSEEFAKDLIAHAGYSDTPQRLSADFGGGVPEATGNEIFITEAERKAQELLNSFQANRNNKNLYDAPSADAPMFEAGSEEYIPTFTEAQNLYPYYPPNLIQAILDVWTETGEIGIAISEARASDTFDKEFPGIKRPDGS